jgi:hypothetical protein
MNMGYDSNGGMAFYRLPNHEEIGGGRFIRVWEQQYFYDSGTSVAPFPLGSGCTTTSFDMQLNTTYAPGPSYMNVMCPQCIFP